ncbi:MAG: CinA family protein [Propionibacteriaceae bacterium]|nr:CinA family protein [Propionibacteriaceae bacterium]
MCQVPVTASEVVDRLKDLHETAATCESITGGLICATLTSAPGASQAIRGGLITYATDLKTSLAAVDPAIILDHGVVSRPVALAMAHGAARACQADWGVAVTGVAGPGPSEGVPAGTVWLAVVGPRAQASTMLEIPGDRATVRQRVVEESLDFWWTLLSSP